MQSITFRESLTRLRNTCGLHALPFFEGGLFRESADDPDTSTPLNTPFFFNTTSGAVFYINEARSGWIQVLDGADFPDQTLLTADT